MTRCSLELTATLGKTRVPFIVAMVLNFVLLYAVTAVALFFSTIQVIILIYYVLLAVSVAIFYLVISSKVIKALRRIRESRKLSKRQNRRLDRTQQVRIFEMTRPLTDMYSPQSNLGYLPYDCYWCLVARIHRVHHRGRFCHLHPRGSDQFLARSLLHHHGHLTRARLVLRPQDCLLVLHWQL